MKPSISLILPAYNEEKNIKEAIARAKEALEEITSDYEIIVVDDGSKDSTRILAESVKEKSVKVVYHEKNRGYASALRTGFEEAVNSKKDLIFYTDADNQFDLGEIKKIIPLIDGYDVIVGYRVGRKDKFHRKIMSKGYNILIRILLGIKVRDVDCSFKLFRRKAIENITIDHEGWLVDTEIIAKVIKAGFSIKEVPVTHYPREGGSSAVNPVSTIITTFIELAKLKLELLRN